MNTKANNKKNSFSNSMKITFFETKDWEEKYFRSKLKNHQLHFERQSLNAENAKKYSQSDCISVFIYSKLDAKLLSKFPKLKLIATRSTGFDHIDLGYCNRRKIAVSNVPSYGENTVAEHAFALILSLSRNIHKSYHRTINNNFSIDGLEGFDLKNKTLGVIGAGLIGLHMIRMAKGFGMKVLASDVNQNKFLAEILDFDYVSLEELLKSSDIISIHAPYNQATHHLINKQNIKLIKKGALLINTARGGIVDTEALIEALSKKILSGAGLDVVEGEELIKEEKQLLSDENKVEQLGKIVKDHILFNMDNVVFTPHIAFYSREALTRINETTWQNISAFSAQTPKNLVNKK